MECDEEARASWWKLWLTGNLTKEEGGTDIMGFDWIRIQYKKGM